MRPLRIEVEGFSAFRESTVVDFEGVDLAAFVGPTGAGKSSLLDAIPFALYGSIPRYDDKKVIAPIIHQLANEARVRVDFELGGQRYAAVRVVRRKKDGGAITRGIRLDRLVGDSAANCEQVWETLAADAKEMSAAVASVVGLDFDQFTKTVLLPQGEFAALLHQKGSERQALLRQLLDLEKYVRVGQVARDRERAGAAAAAALGAQLAEAPSPEALVEAEAKLVRFQKLSTEVEGLLETWVATTTGLVELRAQLDRDRSVLAQLAAISMPDEVTDLGARQVVAADAASGFAATASMAEEVVADVDRRLRPLPPQATLEAALRAHADLESVRRERAGLETTSSDLRAARVALAERAASSADTLRAAESVVAAASAAAGAAALIDGLQVGDPCPVCRRVIDDLPDHDPDAELKAAKSALSTAKQADDAARRAVTDAERDLSVSDARIADLGKRLTELTGRVAESPEREIVERMLAERSAVESERAAAVAARDEAVAAADAGARLVAALDAEATTLRRAFIAARDSVTAHTPPAPGGTSLVDDWAELVAWAGDEAETVTALFAASEIEIEIAARRSAEQLQQFTRLCVDAGVPAEAVDPSRLLARIAKTVGSAESDIVKLRVDLARAEQQRGELGRVERESAVARALAGHLASTGFERWLVAEALGQLIERASDRLLQLSEGRYALEITDSADFVISDRRNGEERRGIRTLSGGETFLASLALALALSDSIAEMASVDAPSLDAVFLDEGFGTLDVDALDAVAVAIDELGASGRMVCIVTHIRELAERMPVRFEVSRGPTTSTVTRIDAA